MISKNNKFNKGFTLIELLVVISIISVLSSIMLASTNTVKAKARDSTRIQTVHQMDLAIKLYAADHNGDVPKFAACGDGDTLSCTAASGSSNGNNGITNWGKLTTDLSPYIKALPSSLNGIDYIYIAPSPSQDQSTYQVSTKLEVLSGSNTQTGYSNINGGVFVDVNALINQNSSVRIYANGSSGTAYLGFTHTNVDISWTGSNLASCTGSTVALDDTQHTAPDFSGSKSSSGGSQNVSIVPYFYGRVNFIISCTGNGGGSFSSMVTVNVPTS